MGIAVGNQGMARATGLKVGHNRSVAIEKQPGIVALRRVHQQLIGLDKGAGIEKVNRASLDFHLPGESIASSQDQWAFHGTATAVCILSNVSEASRSKDISIDPSVLVGVVPGDGGAAPGGGAGAAAEDG